MNVQMLPQLLTVSEAARILGKSEDAIRAYADNQKLPALRTRGGQRLFRVDDVEAFAKRRAEKLAGSSR